MFLQVQTMDQLLTLTWATWLKHLRVSGHPESHPRPAGSDSLGWVLRRVHFNRHTQEIHMLPKI